MRVYWVMGKTEPPQSRMMLNRLFRTTMNNGNHLSTNHRVLQPVWFYPMKIDEIEFAVVHFFVIVNFLLLTML